MEPFVRVQVFRGVHAALARFVEASSTMEMLVVPVMVNPNWLFCRPKVQLAVWIEGFHNTAGGGPTQ